MRALRSGGNRIGMKDEQDRHVSASEAPMVITPRMVVRLVSQTITSLRRIANKTRHR
jgi:hypothetical protein